MLLLLLFCLWTWSPNLFAQVALSEVDVESLLLLIIFVPAALMSVKEMAKGITYDDPIKTR